MWRNDAKNWPKEFFLKSRLLLDSHFIIANGRIVNYPVVYCTEAFARLFGYDRAEIMLKSACCTFLFGEMTDDKATSRMHAIFGAQMKDSVELLLYKRNRERICIFKYFKNNINDYVQG